jgi:hypothetical protein
LRAAFFFTREKTRQKVKLKIKNSKKVSLEIFPVARCEEKKGVKSQKIHIFGFTCVAKNMKT